MKTVADIIVKLEGRLRQPIGQSGSLFTTQQIIDFSNMGLKLLNLKLQLLRAKHVITISGTATQEHTLLGVTGYSMVGIVAVTYNNEGPGLNQREFPYILDCYGDQWNVAGTPKDFWFSDEIYTSILFAKYASSGTYEIYYVREPDEITDTSTDLPFPEIYVEAVCEWCWWCMQLESKVRAALDLLAMGKPAPAFFSTIDIIQGMRQNSKMTPRGFTTRQMLKDPKNI